jgi:hypothetical protein
MQKEKLQLAGAFIDLLPFELAITKFTNKKNFVIKAGFSRAKGRYKFMCHVVMMIL